MNSVWEWLKALFKLKRFWCVLLIPLCVLLTRLAHSRPAATERWFSEGIYRFLTETYGRVFGYLPFSVFQFLIIVFVIAVLWYIGVTVYRLFVKREQCGKYSRQLLANGAFVVGMVWFMLTIGVGLNYARLEFGEIIGLEIRPSNVEELAVLTEILVGHANTLSPQVERNEYGHMIISAGSTFALSQEARVVFRQAGETFPALRGFVPHTKPVLYSRLLSQVRITGVYVPFTMEPHVNVHVPDYHIPATMIHELAHFRGIMREDEANFIAWLVGYHSGHPDFAYSGTMLALAHAANQLQRACRYSHARVMAQLCETVWVDFRANREYWQQFQGRAAEIGRAANDAYLRANRQTDGIYSYGRMVDLLLAYFRNDIYTIIQERDN